MHAVIVLDRDIILKATIHELQNADALKKIDKKALMITFNYLNVSERITLTKWNSTKDLYYWNNNYDSTTTGEMSIDMVTSMISHWAVISGLHNKVLVTICAEGYLLNYTNRDLVVK